MIEAALGEEAPALRRAAAGGPCEGRHPLVGRIVEVGIGADIEVAAAVVLECGERRMFAEHVGDPLPGEGLAETQSPRDLGHHPPVLPCLARRQEKGSLTRDATFGVGDGAVLLGPGEQSRQARRKRPLGPHRLRERFDRVEAAVHGHAALAPVERRELRGAEPVHGHAQRLFQTPGCHGGNGVLRKNQTKFYCTRSAGHHALQEKRIGEVF